MMFCINPIVTHHFEMLVRDMNHQSFNEVNSRDAFRDSFMIFVPGIMKSNRVSVIRIDSGGSNNRASQISADIFNCDIRRTKIWFGSDIKPIRMIFINLIFKLVKRRSKFTREFL